MTHTTLQIQVPTPVLCLGINREYASERVTEWLVLSLFTDGHISSGKAAQLLDISRIEFLALLRKRSIAYLNYSEEELAEEWQAVANLPTPEAE